MPALLTRRDWPEADQKHNYRVICVGGKSSVTTFRRFCTRLSRAGSNVTGDSRAAGVRDCLPEGVPTPETQLHLADVHHHWRQAEAQALSNPPKN